MPTKLRRFCLALTLDIQKNSRMNSFVIKPKHIIAINRQCVFSTTTFQRFPSNDLPLYNPELAKVDFINGLIKLTIMLPARNEKCEFSLKLLNDSVGTLVEYLKQEDKSIEKAQVFNIDGTRISQNTSIGSVITSPFTIKINDNIFRLEPPNLLSQKAEADNLELQAKKDLEDLKQLVSKLYLHLNVEQFETEREEKIAKELELLKIELAPMEKVSSNIVENPFNPAQVLAPEGLRS